MMFAREPIDVCIIGSGPAGAVLGAALVEGGLRVVVLESGPRHPFADRARDQRRYLGGVDPWEREPSALDVASSVGPLFYQLVGRRVRGVGGTSLHWAAECPRMHASDFRLRSRHGLAQDWPLEYDELEPYYVRAESELGVSGGTDPFASPRSAGYPMPPLPYNYLDQTIIRSASRAGLTFSPIPQARNSRPYRGRSACRACGTCHVCPIGAKASVDLTHIPVIDGSDRGRVIENASVLRLETGPDGRVRRAVYAGLDRVERSVEASLFVVGAGGVESPRLLLLSAGRDFPDGLANRSGLVGVGFMEHPSCASVGRVSGPSYAERISFYTATCNQFWDTPERGRRAAYSVQIPPSWGGAPADIAQQSELWGDQLSEHVRQEFGHAVKLESPLEMLPDPDNRIDLDPDLRDYFGNPAPRIRLGMGAYEVAGMREAHAVHARLLEAHGATDVVHDTEVAFQCHHGGTCRMGDDPGTSVVDRNLRAHDVPNLYVSGSSVFVTMGLANPTLTIVALTLRLADHLLALRGAGTL